jgi:signal recognition particle GTPase
MASEYRLDYTKAKPNRFAEKMKMGPLSQIMDMLPGQMGQAARGLDPTVVEKSFKRPKPSSTR